LLWLCELAAVLERRARRSSHRSCGDASGKQQQQRRTGQPSSDDWIS